MSAITGFNITPDSGTSLRKMFKYNLEGNLTVSVRAGASKEFCRDLEKAMLRMEDNTTVYRDTGKKWKRLVLLCHLMIHMCCSYRCVYILTSVDDIQMIKSFPISAVWSV